MLFAAANGGRNHGKKQGNVQTYSQACSEEVDYHLTLLISSCRLSLSAGRRWRVFAQDAAHCAHTPCARAIMLLDSMPRAFTFPDLTKEQRNRCP